MRHSESTERKVPISALAGGDNTSDAATQNTLLYIYGYGPTKTPFYEEARAINATDKGALLVINVSVSSGQNLLVMNGSRQDPVEAHVVRTRTLSAQMFEVELAFSGPQSDFWRPFRGTAREKPGTEKRRSPRVKLPRGMTIAWESEGSHRTDISRVSSLSLGGLFIDADDPAPMGDRLHVQFEIPAGTVQGQAVVRRSIKGKGMGVEFTELAEGSQAGFNQLLQKLIGDVRTSKS